MKCWQLTVSNNFFTYQPPDHLTRKASHMFKQNPLTNCDSYKLGHMAQYPDGTELVYSNFTPRSDNHLNIPVTYKNGKMVWFGAQAIIMEMNSLWETEFFNKSVEEAEEMITDFSRRVAPFVGPSGFDLDKIRELHAFGKLPIEVRALPEGSRVNIGVPVMVIMNTDPRFYWITNYLETWISTELWKMSNSATIADAYKRILVDYATKTGSPMEFVQWQAHDFSMRGMSGVADAAKSGAAHLLSFNGTDSLPAVDFLEQFYGGANTFIGGSVPATEHSVMCMGGEEDEIETFRRLIQDIYPRGVVSIVSDTWDFWRVITEYATELKDVILSRGIDPNGLGKVVFRPDSGDPVRIICGYRAIEVDYLSAETLNEACGSNNFDGVVKCRSRYYKVETNAFGGYSSHEEIQKCVAAGAVQTLWGIFGGTITSKGFKVLNERVGLIYGDSITPHRALEIMQRLESRGFASCNIVLGVGSYTYQHNTRDTLGFAMKATYGVVNGKGREIFKAPKTDSGVKKSARGLLKVVKNEIGDYELIDRCTDINDSGELRKIFKDGVFTLVENIETMRARLATSVS